MATFVSGTSESAQISQARSRKNVRWMTNFLVAFVFGVLGLLLGNVKTLTAQQIQTTAISIALDPDAVMTQRAWVDNARLLKVYPKGFYLDGTHAPHITLLQRYVRTSDLTKVYAKVDQVMAKENPANWQLKVSKYEYASSPPVGLAGLAIDPTEDLLRVQQDLIDAVWPLTVETGNAAAFVTTPEEPDINEATINSGLVGLAV